MSIASHGNATYDSSWSATATVAYNGGTLSISDGDVLIASICYFSTVSISSGPSGWSQIGSDLVDVTASRAYSLWYKVASSESGNYVWSLSDSGNLSLVVAAYSGLTSAVLDDTDPGQSGAAYTTQEAPAITTTAAGLLIGQFTCAGSAQDQPAPSGMTLEINDNGTSYSNMISWKETTAATWGPMDSGTPNFRWGARLVSFKGGAAAKDYTKGDYADLPTDDAELETPLSGADITAIESDDGSTYADQSASGQYAIFEFKEDATGKTSVTATWDGKSSLAPSSSTVYLQVYNRSGTPAWETIDSENGVGADTDFTLQATLTDLTNYKEDITGIVAFRVYQLVA